MTGSAGGALVVEPGSGLMGRAVLLLLIAAVGFAVYHITTPPPPRTEDPANMLYFVALLGALGLSLLVPFSGAFDRAIAVGNGRDRHVGTAGHLFVIRAFPIVPAATLSSFMYAYPVWAMALGWPILGDVPGRSTSLGAAIILGSGLYVYRQRGPEPPHPLLRRDTLTARQLIGDRSHGIEQAGIPANYVTGILGASGGTMKDI